MRVLLDTNIIIHRETNKVVKYEIGQLFNWIDRLKLEKYIHPITITEIEGYQNKEVVKSFSIKLDSYNQIKHASSFSDQMKQLSDEFDANQNDINDSYLLNEVFEERMDLLITEDKKIHRKANKLFITDRVFTIQSFLEKVISENPSLVEYDVLAVEMMDFAEVNINDTFFDSFREDYKIPPFDRWFKKKSDDQCYVCYSQDQLTAFLYIKPEGEDENYQDISPPFVGKKRLKIGTLKVTSNGYKIGERFLKIVFDNAIRNKVEEIYVTVFDKRPEQIQLIEMMEEWGFMRHGMKSTENGSELVLVRQFGKKFPVDIKNPKLSFPYFSRKTRKFIVKIEPQYHDELFPDSLNTRADKTKFRENEPHRNRIGKVYISHSKDRDLESGDIIIMYRMGENTPKKYSSTITSICIVEEVVKDFESFDHFYKLCARRTMIKKEDLEVNWWNKYNNYKPFVIKFLYAHSLPTPKPTLNDLNQIGVIPDIKNMPRGFIEIDNVKFEKLVSYAYKVK
ncbi:PIN domain-containing protein [Reichenbachiella sp.]|uniref:PIN domain-containing protein n=1 Tax=Reichenbachiella sp. TaxID=2184521 RepID=UPI003297B691